MKNNSGEKVRDIIRKECDSRMEMAVVAHILGTGWDKLAKATEDDINNVEGNGLMTKEFCQALTRAAVRICKECNMFDDFLPFIVNYLYVPNAKMKEMTMYKEEFEDEWRWKQFLYDLDIADEEDVEDIDMIVLNANVIETGKFGM